MGTKTIAILGGSGFVGHHLVTRLTRDGHRIRILSRHPERHRDLLVQPGVTTLPCNPFETAEFHRAIEGCDAFINLVGILHESRRTGFHQAHVELPRRVIEACRTMGLKRLLHMSALGASDDAPSRYLRSKAEGESLVHRAGDLQVTSFRPSVIFGPDDSFFNRFAALLKLTPILPLACPGTRMAPIYVGDVAEAYTRSLDLSRSHGQRYELCGPRDYSLKELVELTARWSGMHRWVIGLGPLASRLQANLLQFAPGKPFTPDNYRSLQRDSICTGPLPPELGIITHSIESIMPDHLAAAGGGPSDRRRR